MSIDIEAKYVVVNYDIITNKYQTYNIDNECPNCEIIYTKDYKKDSLTKEETELIDKFKSTFIFKKCNDKKMDVGEAYQYIIDMLDEENDYGFHRGYYKVVFYPKLDTIYIKLVIG